MRKSRFSEAQIALKEGESGVPINDLIRKHGISRPTCFNWRAKYGGVAVGLLPVLRTRTLGQEGLSLKLNRTDIAQRRMPSPRIVEALDIVEHIGTSLIAS